MKIESSELFKLNKVIQSCETLAHYKTAVKYCDLYITKLYKDSHISDFISIRDINNAIDKDLLKKKSEIQNEEMSLR